MSCAKPFVHATGFLAQVSSRAAHTQVGVMAAVGPMFGITRMQSIRAGMLLAAGGEFAFVAFGESHCLHLSQASILLHNSKTAHVPVSALIWLQWSFCTTETAYSMRCWAPPAACSI